MSDPAILVLATIGAATVGSGFVYGVFWIVSHGIKRVFGERVTIRVRTADGRVIETVTWERPGSDLLRAMNDATRSDQRDPPEH